MKRLILTTAIIFFCTGMISAHEKDCPQNTQKNCAYKDSLTEVYYPGMYNLSPNSLPFVPKNTGDFYRSELGVINSPYDTIRCITTVGYGTQKDHHGNWVVVDLLVKDFTYPRTNEVSVTKGFKRLKKHMKFKVKAYLRFCPPDYEKEEMKCVTAHIHYSPMFRNQTYVWYDVKPVKFSKKAKYGPFTDEDFEKERIKRAKDQKVAKEYYARLNKKNRKKNLKWSWYYKMKDKQDERKWLESRGIKDLPKQSRIFVSE